MVNRRGKEEPGTNGSNKGKIKFRYMDSERVVDFSVENMTGDSVTTQVQAEGFIDDLIRNTVLQLKI